MCVLAFVFSRQAEGLYLPNGLGLTNTSLVLVEQDLHRSGKHESPVSNIDTATLLLARSRTLRIKSSFQLQEIRFCPGVTHFSQHLTPSLRHTWVC